MREILFFLAVFVFALGLCQEAEAHDSPVDMRLAMISDYGGIADQSFNQEIYEACKTYAETHGTPFTCFQAVARTDEEYLKLMEDAARQGCNVIVAPGDIFVDALKIAAVKYPGVKFIALDVKRDRLGKYALPDNLYIVVYREELSGYMAGYAAVKLGYSRLGFLGGMNIPAVRRYGHGFVQGINDAAREMGKSGISVNYAYAGQFEPDEKIVEAMDAWYQEGTQVVFACGGSIYKSVAEAAEASNGKIIGVDVDQSGIIDAQYAKGMTVTSAMKDITGAVGVTLSGISKGTFRGGRIEVLGIVGKDPQKNFVKLPMETTQWNDGFTRKDYRALVAAMSRGKVNVSMDLSKSPTDFATNITVREFGNLTP